VSQHSFEPGEGRWLGGAEVYDGSGRFAGTGHDARAVRRDLGGATVEVEVTFKGPFCLSGAYVIADHGDHRLYQGPLNYGYAEALGGGLVDANNYWPDLGFSQRLLLMVLPGGGTQLSLALLSRGEQSVYTVVGEYSRQSGGELSVSGSADHAASGSASADGEPSVSGSAGHPAGADRSRSDWAGRHPAGDSGPGRPRALLERPGAWSGRLSVLDADGNITGATHYAERVADTNSDRQLATALSGTGFAEDATAVFTTGGRQRWTGGGAVVGSESVWGGRALAGNLHFDGSRLRLWRREVARRDGTSKGVLHVWYRGGARIGAAFGVLDFAPAGQRA